MLVALEDVGSLATSAEEAEQAVAASSPGVRCPVVLETQDSLC